MMESATDQAMSCREPAALQAAALEAFDRANAADPNCETVDGVARPKELLYGRRMSDWLERLYPEATPALRLAVRCQHIERWQVPRKTYPEGRVGYLTWRRDLKALHAKRAGEILEGLGFDGATIQRVCGLVNKENLRQDPDAQALEDVACLVFLAHYFADFAAGHDDDKVVEILRKTWRKMSETGREAALALPLGPTEARLVAQALGHDLTPVNST